MSLAWAFSAGAGDENRTRALSLGSSCSTIKLHPRDRPSGRADGFTLPHGPGRSHRPCGRGGDLSGGVSRGSPASPRTGDVSPASAWVRRVVGEGRCGVLWRAGSGVSIEVVSGRRAMGWMSGTSPNVTTPSPGDAVGRTPRTTSAAERVGPGRPPPARLGTACRPMGKGSNGAHSRPLCRGAPVQHRNIPAAESRARETRPRPAHPVSPLRQTAQLRTGRSRHPHG